jgi:NAD(P)-dependent dehydrogenase (short-subunit alcohol dehydrogenase family)
VTTACHACGTQNGDRDLGGIQLTKRIDGQVALVTGGGGGIGSCIALSMARRGAVVVVVDTGVGVQGEPLSDTSAEETVALIASEGGTGVASSVSVTDRNALGILFENVVRDYGSLDYVFNTAGMLRFATLIESSEDDWTSVLETHVDGYINVLLAAVPIMEKAGHGRIVAFTSGAGLARTSRLLSYGTGKRAVASLTWELAPLLPKGIILNALSPIAATRMVRETILAYSNSNPSALDLSAMPQAADMTPAAEYLAIDAGLWSNGKIIFSAGSELSLIGRPKLLEAVRSRDAGNFHSALGTLFPEVFAPAEVSQRAGGGSNPRFGNVFANSHQPSSEIAADSVCVIVSDDVAVAAAIAASAKERGLIPVGVGAWEPFSSEASTAPVNFAGVEVMLKNIAAEKGKIGSLVIALSDDSSQAATVASWHDVLASHSTIAQHLVRHAAWLRGAARIVEQTSDAVRIVHVNDASTASGRTAAQAVTQMVRSVNEEALPATFDAFSIALESADAVDLGSLGDLVARLLTTDDGQSLRGTELVAADGWIGIRSHPAPITTVSYGGPDIPEWVDLALERAVLDQE